MNIAKHFFSKFLWNSPTQSRIRCSIYQNKFTRQDGESMKSQYLRYANLATNFQPATSEEDLVGALTSHYPVAIQRSLISGHIKTTQYVIHLLGKPDALEEHYEHKNPGRTETSKTRTDLSITRRVIRQKPT